ncbi:MAG TPA: cytidylate kinase-like family protein [Armatimonadota bacterium]|jgi:hypothetical protein
MSAKEELADRRIREWFLREQAQRQSRSHTHRPGIPHMITISRQYGAGGHTVAEALVTRLGKPWEIWDRSIIEKMAESANVQKEMVLALDEHARTWVDETIHFAMGLGVMEQATFRKHLALVLASLAQQGHIITIGRGANFILPEALNVRLMANLETRSKTIMQLEGIDHAHALKRIQQVDRERADYTRRCFDRDINDPTAYDMVLSTGKLGIETTVEAIAVVATLRFK